MNRTRAHISLVVVALLLGATLAGGVAGAVAAPHSALSNRQEFHDDMRKLWEDHITWTRLAIVSFGADLDDLGPTLERLLQNQDYIGAAVAPFYGEVAGAALAGLLREHIDGAVAVLVAARDNPAGLDDALDAWYVNGEEIADFLHEANPRFWPHEELRQMMRHHLDLTLAEATARLQGDFAADIAAYEEVHIQILEMADMLSSGIIRQFPSKFAG
jgi:hypothetical protein